jgi:hypothetical protein
MVERVKLAEVELVRADARWTLLCHVGARDVG